MLPKIKSARYVILGQNGQELPKGNTGGWPALLIDFQDGRQARIHPEQKPLANGTNAVILDDNQFPDERISFKWPGKQSTENLCGTMEDRIVGLTLIFLSHIQEGTFAPGPVAFIP